jgi:hypothetical protein
MTPPTAPRAGKAREVLGWCRYGHRKMMSDPTGQDWVLIWAGTIALLRAVGHALEKDDAKSDARVPACPSSGVERHYGLGGRPGHPALGAHEAGP